MHQSTPSFPVLVTVPAVGEMCFQAGGELAELQPALAGSISWWISGEPGMTAVAGCFVSGGTGSILDLPDNSNETGLVPLIREELFYAVEL